MRAPSQLIIPPHLDSRGDANDTTRTPKTEPDPLDGIAPPVVSPSGAPIEADWFDEGDAQSEESEVSALESIAIDFDELDERADELDLDKPAKRKWGLAAIAVLLVAGGVATAAVIAFSGGGGDSLDATTKAAPGALADSDDSREAAPKVAQSAAGATTATPMPAAPQAPAAPSAEPVEPEQATPAPAAPDDGVVLHRATFTTEPAGATVTLVMDGKPVVLGPSPADAQLDPGKSYEVVFTMPGRETVLRAIAFDDSGEVAIAATLDEADEVATTAEPIDEAEAEPEADEEEKAEKPAPVAKKRSRKAKRSKRARRAKRRANRAKRRANRASKRRASRSKKKSATKLSGNRGVLMIASKPPCDIIVDGKRTGKKTPQRSLVLPAGKHTIKLINRRYRIATRFRVKIEKGGKTKVIKDLTDRMR